MKKFYLINNSNIIEYKFYYELLWINKFKITYNVL